MKVAKIRKKEEKKREVEVEEYSLKNMLKIIVILVIIFGAFYLITVFLAKPAKQESIENNAVVDASKITINQLLTRSEEEYYVIASKKSLYESSYIETNYVKMYNDYINKYKQKDNSLKFYYIDLDDALNKKYFSDELYITEEITKMKLNDEVLFKIKQGKIEKTYIGKEKIIDKLARI